MAFLVLVLSLQAGPAAVQLPADKTGDAAARKALAQLVKDIRMKDLPAAERDDAVRRLARLLSTQTRTAEEVLEVIGSDTAKSVSRQVLFRRYVEQWTLDPPLPLVIRFDCPLGQEPRLRSVLVTSR